MQSTGEAVVQGLMGAAVTVSTLNYTHSQLQSYVNVCAPLVKFPVFAEMLCSHLENHACNLTKPFHKTTEYDVFYILNDSFNHVLEVLNHFSVCLRCTK